MDSLKSFEYRRHVASLAAVISIGALCLSDDVPRSERPPMSVCMESEDAFSAETSSYTGWFDEFCEVAENLPTIGPKELTPGVSLHEAGVSSEVTDQIDLFLKPFEPYVKTDIRSKQFILMRYESKLVISGFNQGGQVGVVFNPEVLSLNKDLGMNLAGTLTHEIAHSVQMDMSFEASLVPFRKAALEEIKPFGYDANAAYFTLKGAKEGLSSTENCPEDYKNTVFGIFDESTYLEGSACTTGHPYDNNGELFASATTCMRLFPEEFMRRYNQLDAEQQSVAKDGLSKIIGKYAAINDDRANLEKLFSPEIIILATS